MQTNMSACITYSFCSGGSASSNSFVNPRGIIILIIVPLDYFGHDAYLRILIACIWGKDSVEGGRACALQSHLTLKNGTKTSDFQLNEPSPKAITPPVAYEVPLGGGS